MFMESVLSCSLCLFPLNNLPISSILVARLVHRQYSPSRTKSLSWHVQEKASA